MLLPDWSVSDNYGTLRRADPWLPTFLDDDWKGQQEHQRRRSYLGSLAGLLGGLLRGRARAGALDELASAKSEVVVADLSESARAQKSLDAPYCPRHIPSCPATLARATVRRTRAEFFWCESLKKSVGTQRMGARRGPSDRVARVLVGGALLRGLETQDERNAPRTARSADRVAS